MSKIYGIQGMISTGTGDEVNTYMVFVPCSEVSNKHDLFSRSTQRAAGLDNTLQHIIVADYLTLRAFLFSPTCSTTLRKACGLKNPPSQ